MRRTLFLLLLFPSIASAWGGTAHKVICDIALAELTPPARAEVDRLINLDPDFATFADSCVFADIFPRKRPPDHFINFPRNTQAIATDDCPMAATCLFTAIEGDSVMLADMSNADEDRLRALKLLGHWVGDIHQPLHISFRDDRGGNDIKEQGGPCDANLHSTWDKCVLEERSGTDVVQIVARLRSEITEHERTLWIFDSPVEWANESYQITTLPSVQYCTQQQGACWYSPNNMMLSEGEEERTLTIRRTYIATHRETVDLRLKQAGIRLGALLNGLLQ